MQIAEVTWRHRNDFHWIGECRHCGHRTKWADGYADTYYCTQVAPGRYCPECGLNCHGDRSEADEPREEATTAGTSSRATSGDSSAGEQGTESATNASPKPPQRGTP